MPDDHLYSLNTAPSFTICAVVARFPATGAVRLHPPWSPTREAARRSSDMRQARHLPQRWYWSIVVQKTKLCEIGYYRKPEDKFTQVNCEVASADEEAARKYPEKLAKIIKDGEYCAHQVFNADETGLFWKKKMPTRTFAKSEKTASGFKAAKDRVTLLLCSNASGDRMLKPLLVNRSLKPRALKGKDLNTLPVHWMANKKAWVVSE
ncbi:tigger transposable element-derived protein 1 [Trichonephila clavipes]|nr:tigger transposable element-derived protein 1 [Trichonephila clavipes]